MAEHTLLFRTLQGVGITGLSPVFTLFRRADTGTDLTPPVITEDTSGFYSFTYDATFPVRFIADGGAGLTNSRERYVQGVLEPTPSLATQDIAEILALLRNDLIFVEEGQSTFQRLLRDDGSTWREWEVTDQMGRSVAWPTTSRLPVNRERTR